MRGSTLLLFTISCLCPTIWTQQPTLNTTEFLRLDQTLGSVQPGKLADLVVLSADPLEDISNTRRIEMVIKDGKLLERRFHKDYDPIIKTPRGEILQRGPTTYWGSPYYDRPLLTGLEPGLATEGSADLEIIVEGMGFSGASVVRFVNHRLRTEFKGPEQLRAVIPARLLRAPGTWPLTVENPPPGGGISHPFGFIVKFR